MFSWIFRFRPGGPLTHYFSRILLFCTEANFSPREQSIEELLSYTQIKVTSVYLD